MVDEVAVDVARPHQLREAGHHLLAGQPQVLQQGRAGHEGAAQRALEVFVFDGAAHEFWRAHGQHGAGAAACQQQAQHGALEAAPRH